MIEIQRTIPVLRIFDEAKAREFYLDWLGCTLDFKHRFEPAAKRIPSLPRSLMSGANPGGMGRFSSRQSAGSFNTDAVAAGRKR